MICLTDGTERIVGIVLTVVGALLSVLTVVILCVECLFKENHNVSHFQF